MKRIFLIISVLIVTSSVYPQTVDDRRQELQKLIAVALSEDRIADVITAATELTTIEKSLGDPNVANYAMALTNLALWKQRLAGTDYYDSAAGFAGSSADVTLFREKARMRLEIRSHLEEAIALYRSKIDDPVQFSSVLFEYGNHKCRLPIGTDDLPKLSEPLRESLAIRDRIYPGDSDPVINVLFILSECEFNIGNFEEYHRAQTRLLPALEKRFGTESKRLLPVLVTLERFLILTDRASEANNLVKRISTIAGDVYGISPAEDIVMMRFLGKREKLRGQVVERASVSNRRISVPDPLTPAKVGGVFGQPGMSIIFYPNRTIEQTNPSVITRSRSPNLVVVEIVVDESGSVIEANANVPNAKTKKKVELKVKGWKFRPLIIDGVGRRMIGSVLVNS